MKLNFIFYLLFTTILFSCKKKDETNKELLNDIPKKTLDKNYYQNSSYLKEDGDSLIIDPFEVEIVLTEKAKNKIINSKETIIASLFFYGYPKDSTKTNSEKDNSIYLTGIKKEIHYGENIHFENLKISKKDFAELVDKDFELNLNVFSGRKSTNVNLLNCEPLFDKISNVANKKFTLKGKLIYNDD